MLVRKSLHDGGCGTQPLRFSAEEGWEAKCEPVGPTRWPNASLHLCRRGEHGTLLVATLADDTDVAMLLRVGGPHPQTSMFERSAASARVWIAPFSRCLAGTYTLSTTLVLRRPWEHTEGGTWLARQACAVHHLPSEQRLLLADPWSFEHAAGAPHATPPPRCAQCLWSWDAQTAPATRHVLDRLQTRQPHPHFHPRVPPDAVQHHLRYSLSSIVKMASWRSHSWPPRPHQTAAEGLSLLLWTMQALKLAQRVAVRRRRAAREGRREEGAVEAGGGRGGREGAGREPLAGGRAADLRRRRLADAKPRQRAGVGARRGRPGCTRARDGPSLEMGPAPEPSAPMPLCAQAMPRPPPSLAVRFAERGPHGQQTDELRVRTPPLNTQVACDPVAQQASHGVCATRFLTYFMAEWGPGVHMMPHLG